MTTYKSYEAAKIANPESDIYTNGFAFATSDGLCTVARRVTKCNPVDHCMTFNQCNEFKSGMIVMHLEGIDELTEKAAGLLNEIKPCGAGDALWDKCYILRAAALETKEPKRTKVEYVKVHNSEAIKAVMEGSIDYWCELNGSYSNLTMDSSLQEFCSAVHRIETPIEWWEDASEFINQTDDDNCSSIMEGKLHVNATLTQDQWCDFARILLEQGE